MPQLERHASHDVCVTLLVRLVKKGLHPPAAHRLVKDVYLFVEKGGAFTLSGVNDHLERLGWGERMMDSFCLELILSLLESECGLEVMSHTVH